MKKSICSYDNIALPKRLVTRYVIINKNKNKFYRSKAMVGLVELKHVSKTIKT